MKRIYNYLVLLSIILFTGCVNLEYFTKQGDYQGALIYCRNLKDTNQREDCFYRLALDFTEMGKYDTALKCFESGKDPAYGQRQIGVKYLTGIDFSKGMQLVYAGTQHNPELRKDLLFHAASQIRDSAEYYLRHQGIEKAAHKFIQSAICYEKSGQYEEGIQCYLKAAKIYLLETRKENPGTRTKSFLSQSEKYKKSHIRYSEDLNHYSNEARLNACLRNAVSMKKRKGDDRSPQQIRSNLAFQVLNLEIKR